MARRNLRQVNVKFETSIKKSNELTLSQLNQGLTLNQMQLMSFAILNTQQSGWTSFNKADFERQFEITKYKTEDAKIDSRSVTQTQFYLFDDKKDKFAFQNLFLGMSYDNGLFEFKWNPDLVHHILDLKERYITTDLTITAKFKSGYSWILYEFLKAKYGFWYQEFSVEEFKNLFGVENVKSYEQTGLFKKYVLDKAIAEVNEHTEFHVEYREYKRVRKIDRVTLIWSTGKTIRKALDRQIEQLKMIAEVAVNDWVTVHKEQLNVAEALETRKIVIRLKEIATSITDALTYDYAKELLAEANKLIEELDLLTELANQVKTVNVPLNDWTL